MDLDYSISGGADQNKFSIDGFGHIRFNPQAGQPDYEVPVDFGKDNVYDVVVRVTDGISATTQAIAVVVTDVNESAPVFKTGKQLFVAENEEFVADVRATDADGTSTLTYSIEGGADRSLFIIDRDTGKLLFTSLVQGRYSSFRPDYENQQDTGRNNVYDVKVQVSDGLNVVTQDIAVEINDVNEAPSITSDKVKSVAENQTAILTVQGTDPDARETLTYSLAGGVDDRLFKISQKTGVLEFNAAPDFETPRDSDEDNVYRVDVKVYDGKLSSIAGYQVTVTNVVEGPKFATPAATTIHENTTVVMAVNAVIDSTISYSGNKYGIVNGYDRLLFDIDSTGQLSFKTAPNFEQPGDNDKNNVYKVLLYATDGNKNFAQQLISVTVADVNEAPVFTSMASMSVKETLRVVGIVKAKDEDRVDKARLRYSVSGGADKNLFTINGITGQLAFKSLRDFEVPSDADKNNIFDVAVSVTDGTLTAVQTIAVTLVDVVDGPTITSAAVVFVFENSLDEGGRPAVVQTVTAFSGLNLPIIYEIEGGLDRKFFELDRKSGQLRFRDVDVTDYERPTDIGNNNVYNVAVRASTSQRSTVQAVTVVVRNVIDAPTISSPASVSVEENRTAVQTVAAIREKTRPDAPLTYSITGGDDKDLMLIDPISGRLAFRNAPNYEVPTDKNKDNVYIVGVSVREGEWLRSKTVAVSVTNVIEVGVTSAAALSIAEISTAVGTIVIAEESALRSATFNIAGGDDSNMFTIDKSTGNLAFKVAPNYELPADINGDNVYVVNVRVVSTFLSSQETISNSLTQKIRVTVTNIVDAPTFTSPAEFSAAEGSLSIGTLAAVGESGKSLTYSISTNTTDFSIDSATGLLSFNRKKFEGNYNLGPSFEYPQGANGTNVYQGVVTVNDGTKTAQQSIKVTVTNRDLGPFIITPTNHTIPEKQTFIATIVAIPESSRLNPKNPYSLYEALDWEYFVINRSTGKLAFRIAPTFKRPGSDGHVNNYSVYVKVDDGEKAGYKLINVNVEESKESYE
jgi:hypothetical protein